MDHDSATQFVSSLVQSIQALCHGYVQFNTSVEVVGHIYLNVDKGSKFNYIVNEEVNRDPGSLASIFHTNSYFSTPPATAHVVNLKETVNTEHTSSSSSADMPITVYFPGDSKDVREPSIDLVKDKLKKSIKSKKRKRTPKNSTSQSSSLKVASSKSKRGRKSSKLPPKVPDEADDSELLIQPSPDAVSQIEREPESFHNNVVIENNFSDDEPFTLTVDGEEVSKAASDSVEKVPDDREIPYPVALHAKFADIEGEDHDRNEDLPTLDNGTDPADDSQLATPFSSKGISVPLRRKIIEYANVVGNRPAARHFGVHESSIRHWRKKLGMFSVSGGGKRGRRKKTSTPRRLNIQVMDIAKGPKNVVDEID